MKTILDTPSINGPIVIKVKSKWTYEAIALLVDRDDFLHEVKDIRRHLGINELIRYNELKVLKQEDVHGLSIHFELLTDKSLKDWRSFDSLTPEGIDYLLHKYRKSQAFVNVIRFAILSGYVCDEHFDNDPIYYHAFKRGVDISLDSNEVAFIVYPETKIEQLEERFKQYKDYLKISDVKSEIKRDREWYWMYKKEKTSGRGIYKRIVEDWEKKHLPKDPNDYIDPNKIEQAVSRYKKLLNADI